MRSIGLSRRLGRWYEDQEPRRQTIAECKPVSTDNTYPVINKSKMISWATICLKSLQNTEADNSYSSSLRQREHKQGQYIALEVFCKRLTGTLLFSEELLSSYMLS